VGDRRPVGGRAGIKSFLVLKGTPGFEVAKRKSSGSVARTPPPVYRLPNSRDHLLGGNEEVQNRAPAASAV
jgi:acyl-CoA dehydrogenase